MNQINLPDFCKKCGRDYDNPNSCSLCDGYPDHSECSCKFVISKNGHFISYCLLHGSAPALLNACKIALGALNKLHGASMDSGSIAYPAIEAITKSIGDL